MASKVQLVGGAFQDSEGNVLANGYLELKLNADNSVSGVGNLCAGATVRIDLDSAGNVASSTSTPVASNQFIWATSVMSVSNAFYKVTGFKANGQPVWGPNNQQITGDGGTFDVGTWTPNRVISWVPPVQATTFEVEGTLVANQNLVNFESLDGSITIIDEGDGSINFEVGSGAGASVTGFYSNGCLISQNVASTGSAMQATANSVTGIWINIPAKCVVNKIRMVQAGSSDPNANISVSLYNSGKNKIIDSGAMVQNVGNLNIITVTLSSPVTVTAGQYFFAQAAQLVGSPSGPVNTFVYGASVNPSTDAGTSLFAAAVGSPFTASNVRSGNVMPATLGTLTPLSNGNITLAIFSNS